MWSCLVLTTITVLGFYSQHSPVAQVFVSFRLMIDQKPAGQAPLVASHNSGHAHLEIKTLAIDEDGFLQNYSANISQTDTLPMSFRQLRLSFRKIYRVSLAKGEQMALANSTAAIEIRQVRAEKACTPENLFAKGLLDFLPDYKSPCWYSADQRLRCLPYFLLIGAPKSGTTDIFQMLRLHPDYKYTRKEYHWLTRSRFCQPTPEAIGRGESNISSLEWYTGMIGKPLSQETSHPHVAITGDLSASTMWQYNYWPTLQQNSLPLEPTFTTADFIYHLNNRTKVMAILRNPIDRMFSDYIYFDPTRRKGPHEFHHDVIKSIDYLTNCMEMYSVRSCVYRESHVMTTKLPVRLHVSLYYIYLLDWYRVFPRDQLLIIRLEDYTRQRAQFALKIYNFLELSMQTGLGSVREI